MFSLAPSASLPFMFKLLTEASTDKPELSHPYFKPKGILFITFTLALASLPDLIPDHPPPH